MPARRFRSPRPQSPELADMKRAAFRIEFGSPPANTVTSYQACCVGCVSGLGVCAFAAKPLRWRRLGRLRPLSAITQARNTSAIFAACSAWVLGNRAGLLNSGDGTFSSGAILASPSLRDSFVLRDGHHSKRKNGSAFAGPWRGADRRRRRALQPAWPFGDRGGNWQSAPPGRRCKFTAKTSLLICDRQLRQAHGSCV